MKQRNKGGLGNKRHGLPELAYKNDELAGFGRNMSGQNRDQQTGMRAAAT